MSSLSLKHTKHFLFLLILVLWIGQEQISYSSIVVHAQEDFGEITTLAWSPDGTMIVSSHYTDVIAFWDATSGEFIRSLTISTPELPDISATVGAVWNPTGTKLSLVAWGDYPSYALIIIDTTSNDIDSIFLNEGSGDWSNDPNQVLTVSSEGIYPFNESLIRVRDVSSGQVIAELPTANLSTYAWSPDGTRVAIVHNGSSTVEIWEITTTQLVAELTGHSNNVLSVSWSPVDNNRLATGSQDFTAKIWDISNRQVLVSIPLERFGDQVVWSRDGQRLAVQTDPFARIYDPITGQALTDQFITVLPIDLSPDGSRMITSETTTAFTITDIFQITPKSTPTALLN